MSLIAAKQTNHTVTTEYKIGLDVIKQMVCADLGVDPATVELIWDIDEGYNDERYGSSSPKLRGLKIKVVTK